MRFLAPFRISNNKPNTWGFYVYHLYQYLFIVYLTYVVFVRIKGNQGVSSVLKQIKPYQIVSKAYQPISNRIHPNHPVSLALDTL